MPLFEFACDRCSEQFEVLIRRGETVDCPRCGAANPRKLLSAPAARVSNRGNLPIASSCPPSDAPLCGHGCCRL